MALPDALRRHRRFVVFCLVGGSGVFVNLGVFAFVLCLWPGANDIRNAGAGSVAANVAVLAGWLISVVTNFVLNDRFTFDDQIDRDASTWPKRLARYYLSAAVTYGLQAAVFNGLLYAVTDGFLVGVLQDLVNSTGVIGVVFAFIATYLRTFCNLAGIALGTIVNYALSLKWVFK